jgi:hypothetical protein
MRRGAGQRAISHARAVVRCLSCNVPGFDTEHGARVISEAIAHCERRIQALEATRKREARLREELAWLTQQAAAFGLSVARHPLAPRIDRRRKPVAVVHDLAAFRARRGGAP